MANNFRSNNSIAAVLKMSAYLLRHIPQVLIDEPKQASLYTEVFINISINTT